MSRLSPLSSKLQGFELRLTVTQPKLRIGKDAKECVLPSAFGLTAETLEYGNRGGEPAAKKAKK